MIVKILAYPLGDIGRQKEKFKFEMTKEQVSELLQQVKLIEETLQVACYETHHTTSIINRYTYHHGFLCTASSRRFASHHQFTCLYVLLMACTQPKKEGPGCRGLAPWLQGFESAPQ